jgi:hypothetical protein
MLLQDSRSRLRFITTVLVLLVNVFGASTSHAGTAAGDVFSIRVLVDGLEIASTSGVVGSGALDLCAAPGSNCAPGSQHGIDWIDGDTIEVDWFDATSDSTSKVVYEFTGVDFVSGATPEGILGVIQRPSSLPPADRLMISYTSNSITLDYANLATGEAADGDLGLFDIETDANLADAYGIEIFEDGFSIATATHVRGKAGEFNVVDSYFIEWLDEDSFRIDWFAVATTDVVFEITGLAFKNLAGETGTIENVIKGTSNFPADPTFSFDTDSITIRYLGLAPGESDDGDIRAFDVDTMVSPVDLYTLEIVEDSVALGKGTSARGAADTLALTSDYQLSWNDSDTFEIDWFSSASSDVVWAFEFPGITTSAGAPGMITNVIKGPSAFDDDPSVGFSDDSVTLTYDPIIDAGSGDFREFDLVVPEPSLSSALGFGVLAIAASGARKRKSVRR